MLIRTRLKQRREELGFSIRELAKMTGISAATISRFEAGKTDISAEKLISLLDGLQLNPKPISECREEAWDFYSHSITNPRKDEFEIFFRGWLRGQASHELINITQE